MSKRLGAFFASARVAFSIAFVLVVFGTAWWLFAIVSTNAQNIGRVPPSWGVVGCLAGVVLATYLGLGALGYRVRADGDVKVPRFVAWLVAGLATVLVFGTWLYLSTRK